MADFVDDEAEESSEEEEEHLDRRSKRRAKAMEDSEEEEDDDEDRIREELKDLIDDNPIEESEGEDSDDGGGGGSKKRKKSGSDDYDDQLEDDDYELLEENLGIAVDRKKRFKRLRRVQEPESDDEDEQPGEERDIIANQLFDAGSGDENERMSVRSQRVEEETFDEAGSESHYSDADDFIVDNDGRSIAEKRRNKRPVFSDATLQEAQDIFGVDFDYEEFDKYGDRDASQEEDEEEEEEYMDDEERPRRRKKAPKEKSRRNTIFDIYEPSELKRGHFTDRDSEIRSTDVPERMQERSLPVTPVEEGSSELDEESEWIYRQAFCRATISIQDAHLSEEAKERARKGPQTVPKIKKALDFMRNQNFEVPFISFYRKEYVLPELNINDLWKVYRYDAKWCELRERKFSLVRLFERMRDYQLDEIMKNPEAPLPESMRVIKEEDIDRLKAVETCEELNDVHHHFMLYYSDDIPKMQAIIREKSREIRREDRTQRRQRRIYEAIEKGEEPPAIDENDDDDPDNESDFLKQAVRTGSYSICRKAGLHGLARKFGLPPEEFAENVRDDYQRHEVDQEPIEPAIAALRFCSPQFSDANEVLKAAGQMVAIQLAREPLVRKCVREAYMERAKISIRPTKRGVKEIDENHPIYAMKYLKNKPVRELVGEQFLKLSIAERDKLVTIEFSENIEGTTNDDYIQQLKQLYFRDEFSKNVQEWNALRAASVDLALKRMIIPDMQKELRANLMAEAKEFVLRACCRKMYNWIKVAPFECKIEPPSETNGNVVAAQSNEENWDEDWDAENSTPPPPTPVEENTAEKPPEIDTSKGLRVMGLAYVPDFTQAAFACVVSPSGECTDHLRLPNLLRRRNSLKEDEKKMKEADLLAIRAFISAKKPHVVAVGGESREAVMIAEDIRECIAILNTDERFPVIQVEICENELSKIWAQSVRATSDYRDYPILLRQAISLARRLQDPLTEFSQLCTADEEILCLKFHALQEELPREELLEGLHLEFVNRVNEVGVDVNRALQESSGNLLQFVCGLGPRKAQALLKTLKQTNQRIENRTQLVTTCHMGPKVFINCAGFVKIDTASLGDSTEAYVEVLDGSRVHPETYEWARKMAVDALEYDDDEDANPAAALEDIFKTPDRLKDLDLDAFAEELERQGFGNKAVTLYDIRAELNSRYKDLRAPYESPTPEKLFDMLTKETPESFYIGKMILATVTGIVHKKPEGEQLDQANPLRNDETSLWQCPFCMKNDFPELSEVWGHFDANECQGKPMGVRLRLDNGISGFIHIKNLSDKRVDDPQQRVRPGQIVHCRVIKIEVDRFSVECTSKSSDLADKNNEMRPQRDPFYDTEAEEKDLREEEDAKRGKQQRAYMKRVIVHPAFHNISYAEAAKLMSTMKQGDVIIRPSSKGADRLTVTWKVVDDVLHHIDVREEGKKFGFSLGERLWIGNEEYEDLDEIIARHVNPMAAYASELLECNYYKPNIDGLESRAEEALKERKREKPSSIPCIVSPSKIYPGKFLLSYLPRERCQHEFLTVTPDGVRYRGQVFPTIGRLFSWFKKHFREPRGIATPKTPAANTPGMFNTASGDFTPHHTLSLTADETPSHQFSIATPSTASAAGGFGGAPSYPGTPYTPSSRTPNLTPGQQTPGNGEFQRPSMSASEFVQRRGGSSDRGGRGRGRGANRGRGSYGQKNSFPRENTWKKSWNSEKLGDNTPLWDESESWDSPTEKPGNLPSVPKIGGHQTPLWDESESWDSPGEASLPNDPRIVSRGSSSTCGSLSVPVVETPGVLWDASESWDSPPSESQLIVEKRSNSTWKNDSLARSVSSYGGKNREESANPPLERNREKFYKNRGSSDFSNSSNAPPIETPALAWDATESWDSPPQTTPQNDAAAANVPPVITIQPPAWKPNESWDSPSESTLQNYSGSGSFDKNDDAAMPFSQPSRRDSYNNSSFSARGSRGFSDRGNRGFSDRGNRGFSDRGNRGFSDRGNRGFSDRGNRGFSDRGNRGFSDRGNRGFSDRGNRGFSNRGNRGFSNRGNRGFSDRGNRGFSDRGNRGNDSRRGNSSWNSSRPGNFGSECSGDGQNSTGNQSALWNAEEDWDADDSVVSRSEKSSFGENSQGKSVSSCQLPPVPAIGQNNPLWNESEDWDAEDPVPEPSKAIDNENSRKKLEDNEKTRNSRNPSDRTADLPSAPAVPLWNEAEDWDSPDPVVAQPTKAKNTEKPNRRSENSRNATVFQAGLASAPSVPLWDEAEDWDSSDPVASQPIRASSSENSTREAGKSSNFTVSDDKSTTSVPVVVPNAPLWDESEDWDNPQPTKPQQPRNSAASTAAESSFNDASSSCSNYSSFTSRNAENRGWKPERFSGSDTSSNYGNSSSFSGGGERSIQWKSNRGRNNRGQSGNSRFSGQSSRGSSFQRSRGNQRYNSAGRGQNHDWNSSVAGNSRGGTRNHRFSRDSSANEFQTANLNPGTGNSQLWDQSESWDEPEPSNKNNDNADRGNNSSGDRTQNQNASVAPPIVPVVATLAPLWDESESWD